MSQEKVENQMGTFRAFAEIPDGTFEATVTHRYIIEHQMDLVRLTYGQAGDHYYIDLTPGTALAVLEALEKWAEATNQRRNSGNPR